MEKQTIFGVILLLCTLLLSMTIPAIVNAYSTSATWGTPCTVADQYEKDAMSYTCSYVSNLIAGRAGWSSGNYYDSGTSSDNVYGLSDAVRAAPTVYFLATFHVGDMYREYRSGTLHYNYYDNSGDNNGIEDSALYPHTGAKHYFTFIWTCANGDLFSNPLNGQLCYGYTDTQNRSGIVGMPYAWTKTTSMNQNGYLSSTGSYTYLSFENTSLQLKDNSEFINYNYGDFVRRFYYHAIVDHQTVSAALDSAISDMGTWRNSFDDSQLYYGYIRNANGIDWQCKMRVYGNGAMVLPY